MEGSRRGPMVALVLLLFSLTGVAVAMEPALLEVSEHEVFGEYLRDGDGRALYVVVDESGEPVDCTGECAEAWPPLLATEGMAGMGAADSLIGTVSRNDGTVQLTYDGLPLYYFVNDVEAGAVNCQAVAQFGGTWYILAADGSLNTTPPAGN